jgi:hypothetical protein
VKPLRLAASQGVIRANNAEEFRAAVARTRALIESPEVQVTREPELDRLLVEDYVPGAEVAVEGLIDRGHLRILAIFDKPDPLEGPFFEETIYVTPSRLPAAAQEELSACARRTATALGLSHGPIHAEFRWNDKGPWVIECAPRPIGGLCARALRFGEARIGLEELLLLAGVEEAEGGMILPADHAAAAAIAAGEQAAGRVGCGRCERGSFFTRRGYLIALSRFKFHGSLKGRFGTLRPSTATSGQAEARRARRMKRREVRTSSGATCTRYGITQVTRSQE